MTEDEARQALQNLAAQRNQLTQQAADTTAALEKNETATVNAKRQAAGGLDLTLARQLAHAELGVAAAKAGAVNPDQVSDCLVSKATLVKDASGKHKVIIVEDTGDAKDADAACIDYMIDHPNLVRHEFRESFAEKLWRRDAVAEVMASPPTTTAGLEQVDSRIRQAVVNAMSPEQRAELAKEKAIANTL